MNSAGTWPLRTVALAADMKPRALRQWFETSVITLQGNDRKSTGPGDHCGLSRQRAYQAAIVQHLNKLGMTVSRAAAAAFRFTDEGQTGRAPSRLFEHGLSVLCISEKGATVRNCFYDVSHTEITNQCAAIITVDLNRIVQQVDAVLESNV
jgi:hypothetical protein